MGKGMARIPGGMMHNTKARTGMLATWVVGTMLLGCGTAWAQAPGGGVQAPGGGVQAPGGGVQAPGGGVQAPAPASADPSRAGQDAALAQVLGFVANTGAVSGAAAVCRPATYTSMRLCGILIISNWGRLGNVVSHDQNLQSKVELTWDTAAQIGRDRQATGHAPMSCDTLLTQVSRMSFWQTCQAARAIQDEADKNTDRRPPVPQREQQGNTYMEIR